MEANVICSAFGDLFALPLVSGLCAVRHGGPSLCVSTIGTTCACKEHKSLQGLVVSKVQNCSTECLAAGYFYTAEASFLFECIRPQVWRLR